MEKKENGNVRQRPDRYAKPIPQDTVCSCSDSATLVFARQDIDIEEASSAIQAVLTVTDGCDKGKQMIIAEYRVNIGRRENNEMSLFDVSTSRLHAYLVYETDGHVLYDAESLNGTYVNGKKIRKYTMRDGDVIGVGNTVIRYEVR